MKSIKTYTKDELTALVVESKSLADVLRKLNYSLCKTSYKSLKKILADFEISCEHFSTGLANRKGKEPVTKLNRTEYISRHLVKNGKTKPTSHKLIEFSIFPARCSNSKCKVESTWLDGELTLHVDHINGDSSDHRLENLRLLCPNCHSQTSTYSGRNNKIEKVYCVDCGKPITKNAKRCSKCSGLVVNSRRIKFNVSKNELKTLLASKSFSELGRQFGVSDNSIRKRAKKFGILGSVD